MIERSRVRVPAGTAGEFSSPGSTFCADSYFGIRSTPRVTAVAVALHEVAWLYGVHRTRREGSSVTWHQVRQRCKYVHHFGGYLKTRYKKASHSCRITCECSEFARERRIALYKSDQQQQRPPLTLTGHAINKKGHFKGRSELHKTIFISTLLAYLITTVFKGDSKQRHS